MMIYAKKAEDAERNAVVIFKTFFVEKLFVSHLIECVLYIQKQNALREMQMKQEVLTQKILVVDRYAADITTEVQCDQVSITAICIFNST